LKLKYFGDSYDIVKRSLLRWLGAYGAWVAHPMFTEHVSSDQAAAFSLLLGVPLLSLDIIKAETDRESYFARARRCPDHLFLDPDTGLRLTANRAKNAPSYLFGSEIISIVRERPTLLTLVFDQSLPRGREPEQLAGKLAFLYNQGIASIAYVSHACFILMGTNKELVKKALELIQCESGLPTSRFVMNKTIT